MRRGGIPARTSRSRAFASARFRDGGQKSLLDGFCRLGRFCAPGGTGMSPWNMMNEWGIPTIYMQSLVNEFVAKLAKRKIRVPDLAMAGGFSDEAGIFKALALGAPHYKAVSMGRALMIPGMVGKNIGEWIKAGTLPKTVSKFGSNPEEIFVSYEELKAKFGKDVEKIPLGPAPIKALQPSLAR